MAWIQAGDPRVLKKKTENFVFQFVFGGIFAVVGVFMIVTGIAETLQKGPGAALIAAIVGSVFALAGLAIMLSRAGVEIDARSGVVASWWRCACFGKRREISVDQLDHVSIQREVRRSKNSSYTVYPVRLQGLGKPVDLDEPREFNKARLTAEQVAKLLQLNIVDTTSGTEVVREHDKLDESIRQQAKRTGEAVEVPEPPADTKVTFSIEGDELTLDLPPKGLGAAYALLIPAMLVPIVVVTVILSGVFGDADMPKEMKIVIVAFVGVGFVLLPALVLGGKFLKSRRDRTRVVASLDELRIEERGLVGARTTTFAAKEIEEFNLASPRDLPAEIQQAPPFLRKLLLAAARKSSGSGIHVRSDTASVQFGGHLSADEQRWIYAVIKRMLTA